MYNGFNVHTLVWSNWIRCKTSQLELVEILSRLLIFEFFIATHFYDITFACTQSGFPKLRAAHTSHSSIRYYSSHCHLARDRKCNSPPREEEQEEIDTSISKKRNIKERKKRKSKESSLSGKADQLNEWFCTHQAHDAVCAHARSVLGFYSRRWSPE